MKEIIRNPEPEEYSAAHQEPRRARYGKSWCMTALAVIGVAAAVVLCIASLLAKAELTKLTDERTELEEQLQTLRDEQARLMVEYESLYSPGTLDEYARSRGMVPLRASQVVTPEPAEEDYAVVYEAEEMGLVERITDAVSAVSEYFAPAGE